jgi:tRNA (cytidine/uridine-2'-O-)-methyltransferase
MGGTEVIGKYEELNFNVVLVEPQIPNNTGNIGRLCVATNSRLHLVHPLGFEITDARVKRAGLDYWPDLEICHHDSFHSWLKSIDSAANLYFFSAKSNRSFYSSKLKKGDYLIFGKEAEGLSKEQIEQFHEQLVTIPFPGKVRSFNLANAVAMVLGEGMRQISE